MTPWPDQKIGIMGLRFLRRNSMDPDQWRHTRLGEWDSRIPCDFDAAERPLVVIYVSPVSWSVFTSRRIRGVLADESFDISPLDVAKCDWGNDPKARSGTSIEVASLQLRDGKTVRFEYEAGTAWMGPCAALSFWKKDYPLLDKFVTYPRALLDHVVDHGLAEVREQRLPVYAIAFYHDQESEAVSICVDTETNSRRMVERMNADYLPHFIEAVDSGDLEEAVSWQANVGRSLSLGDFSAVHLARTDLDGIEANDAFYLSMVQALMARHDDIRALSADPKTTLLACSGPEEEVALVWSLPPD